MGNVDAKGKLILASARSIGTVYGASIGNAKAMGGRDYLPPGRFDFAAAAFRVGLALGDRVVVVGVSTGGGLATWLAAPSPASQATASALVFVSPCYGLGHPLYPFLKKPFTFLRLVPFGLAPPLRAWLLAALMGREKRSPAVSPDHARYNALAYPHPALLHLVDVLYGLEGLDVSRARAPTFLVANHGDAVIDFGRAARVFEALGAALPSAPPKVMVACPSDAHPHVLASQMLSPNTVDGVLDAAILFVRAHTGRDAGLRRKAAPSRPPSFGSVTGLDALMRPFPF
ncbi:alpha/beta hydrolase [Aureococcus anophagefferens]|nr:alpha/beta hydrolase [Aureococcus anophagefferens]